MREITRKYWFWPMVLVLVTLAVWVFFAYTNDMLGERAQWRDVPNAQQSGQSVVAPTVAPAQPYIDLGDDYVAEIPQDDFYHEETAPEDFLVLQCVDVLVTRYEPTHWTMDLLNDIWWHPASINSLPDRFPEAVVNVAFVPEFDDRVYGFGITFHSGAAAKQILPELTEFLERALLEARPEFCQPASELA